MQLVEWLVAHRPAELVVALPSILAHIPLEALLIDGEPLGIVAAIRRLPIVSTSHAEPAIDAVNAYLDPMLA